METKHSGPSPRHTDSQSVSTTWTNTKRQCEYIPHSVSKVYTQLTLLSEHLDTLNRVFRGYTRPFVNHDGANILWMKARALWKSGMALKALRNPVLELEADDMIERAVAMYWDISGKPADGESMRDDSWDDMVFFASR